MNRIYFVAGENPISAASIPTRLQKKGGSRVLRRNCRQQIAIKWNLSLLTKAIGSPQHGEYV